MDNNYSISTAWNYEKGKSAESIISEIESAGFKKLELNFAIHYNLLKELKKIIFRKNLQVKSVHNFCPTPNGIEGFVSPDYFSVASVFEDERKKAVEFTKQTIDTAESLGAKAVVLHCGRVEMSDYSKKLIDLFNQGRCRNEEYKQFMFEMTEERKSKSLPYLNSAIKSIKELSKYAQKKGVIIGIETRYYYKEIPQFDEFEKIFDTVHEPNLLYWHDTGHAQCAENLGITSHIAYLNKYYYRMVGVHIHDTKGTEDHKLPGKGNLDFSILKPYLNSNTIKTLEPHPPSNVEELCKSLKYIDRKLK